MQQVQETLGVTELIKKEFGKNYKEILSVANYFLEESNASYLFPYWHNEHHLREVKKLNSQGLSTLYSHIGRHERERLNFMKSWAKHVNPTSGVYYDITSLSSYSSRLETVEWGYNRDKECLPQMNIGMIHCSKQALPIFYTVYPGSIVDVSTLKNTLKLFDLFELKNLFFILDRGFCSVANIMAMYTANFSFIQPLSFSLKKTKDLLIKHRTSLKSSNNTFTYKEELLYHICDKIELEGVLFDAHLFYDEKAAVHYKHSLYSVLLDLEALLKEAPSFETTASYKEYLMTHVPSKYLPYFKLDGKSKKIVKNDTAIEHAILKAGSFIMVVHGQSLAPFEIVDTYRNRDAVEKDIYALKNQMDGKRIRAHNIDTALGRLFVKFIALITYSKILSVIKSCKKLAHYSINELMAELKKLKVNAFNKNKPFLTELSKKQKLIFDAFNIDFKTIDPNHGY